MPDEDVDRLEEIREEIMELMDEAKKIVAGSKNRGAVGRADAYWIPHIEIALGGEHGYMDRSMCSMQDTIEELRRSND